MTWRVSTCLLPGMAALILCLSPALHAEFVLEVEANGELEGAVVTATPRDADIPRPPLPQEALMVQANRQFDPFILPVPIGVPVRFPNRDDTAHHVYSFSPIGAFELPLYKGESPRTITFSKPGVVPLGCNIHDWMIGYIYVVDTPFYTQITNNSARFASLPPATYDVSIWHPAIADLPVPSWQVAVSQADDRQTLHLGYPFAEVTQPKPPAERFDEQWDY
ncbi:MAG: methylamine utilization protein [Pseudomonadales bacterium]